MYTCTVVFLRLLCRKFPFLIFRCPCPAEDFSERRISLDAELVRYPESTYFLRAQGYSMKDAGIFDGDCWSWKAMKPPGTGTL